MPFARKIFQFVARPGKGPFLYYIRVFWSFFEPPTHLRRDISLHKVRENCNFLDHPTTTMSLRNIKMAPNVDNYGFNFTLRHMINLLMAQNDTYENFGSWAEAVLGWNCFGPRYFWAEVGIGLKYYCGLKYSSNGNVHKAEVC